MREVCRQFCRRTSRSSSGQPVWAWAPSLKKETFRSDTTLYRFTGAQVYRATSRHAVPAHQISCVHPNRATPAQSSCRNTHGSSVRHFNESKARAATAFDNWLFGIQLGRQVEVGRYATLRCRWTNFATARLWFIYKLTQERTAAFEDILYLDFSARPADASSSSLLWV